MGPLSAAAARSLVQAPGGQDLPLADLTGCFVQSDRNAAYEQTRRDSGVSASYGERGSATRLSTTSFRNAQTARRLHQESRCPMLRRSALIGLSASLIGAAIGCVSLASLASGDGEVGNQHRQTFQLLEIQQSLVPEDPGTFENPKPGDLFMIHSVLKTQAGEPAGRADFKCADLSRPPKGVFHCEGTVTFTDGSTIEFAGLGKVIELDFTASVTGGTGRYLGTSGQIFFHSLNPTGTKSLDTFTLTR